MELTEQERYIFDQAIKRGNLDMFTEYYFQLPASGTWFTTEDRTEQYSMLHNAWLKQGKPDESFQVDVDQVPVTFRVAWDEYYAPYPMFLMPHGFRILPWMKSFLGPKVSLGLAVTGAGSGKTCNVAIAALSYAALYPGFKFLNVAPTGKQAALMLGEIRKWASNTNFRKFIYTSRGVNELWVERSGHPLITVEVYEGYPSYFTCQTVGRDARGILGDEQDWINCDEAVLLQGILDAQPVLTTRLRGTRSTGLPRWGKLTWITNPARNAEFTALMEQYREIKTKEGDTVMVLEDVPSTENIYITKRQLSKQLLTMDERTAGRWHGGQMGAVYSDADIGEEVIERCFDPILDEYARAKGEYDDTLGLMRYEMPYENGRHYLVAGDVGKSSLTALSSMNVPCVLVFDVTDFLKQPTRLVAMHWFDGNNTYKTWVNSMKRMMRKYRAMGYYDATSIQSAFEDFYTVFGGMPNTTPVYFSGSASNKRWAIAVFIKLAEDGLLGWPLIKSLMYQARIFNVQSRKQADDVIAAILVFCLALKAEGALYDQLMARYDALPSDEEDDEGYEYDDYWKIEFGTGGDKMGDRHSRIYY